MNKRFIPTLSAFMSFSLLVFISLQLYWLKQAVEANDLDFSSKVYSSLENVAYKINQDELKLYYRSFNLLINNAKEKKNESKVHIVQSIIDSAKSQYILYKKYIIEEGKISIPNYQKDSFSTTKIYKDEGVLRIEKNKQSLKTSSYLVEESIKNSTFTLDEFAKLNITQKPLEKRISVTRIDSLLQNEFLNKNIHSKFEFSVFNSKMHSSKIKTKNYIRTENFSKNYNYILFKDSKDLPQYYLSVYFPDKNFSLLNPIFGSILLTLTSIIIIASIYITSIKFMSRQKKLSEIKTDFINNMSHEFKTPIATISIATDALMNEKIIKNSEKVKYYSKLIKKENQRMLEQVEGVLRISKLEKNMMKLVYKPTNICHLIKNCVQSIKIQIEERGGTINTNYTATQFIANVDAFHMRNAIINLLDNANKYSSQVPKIEVLTYNESNKYVFQVKDYGIGMESEIIKKIFEKFYREETGNIHNVKGHGLGLTYVKKIIDLHGGEIEVESVKNEGSTFRIKILIYFE